MRRIEGRPSGRGLKVAVVAARFNRRIVDRLVDGAVGALRKAGVRERDLLLVRVPGAFEIPLLADALAASGSWDAVVALGCVLKGETAHFEQVAEACARGVAEVSLRRGVPVTLGVLPCFTAAQALARSSPRDNRGAHAARAALEAADALRKVRG